MTIQTADRLHVTAAWLNTLPLPEPSVSCYPNGDPHVDWHEVDVDTALQVIATIGGQWLTHTSEAVPVTIASRTAAHLGTAIEVRVSVAAYLPDLAADAGKLAGAVV